MLQFVFIQTKLLTIVHTKHIRFVFIVHMLFSNNDVLVLEISCFSSVKIVTLTMK